MNNDAPKQWWPHAPAHYNITDGCYMVTCGTYQKQHFFKDGSRLRMLHKALLEIGSKHEWQFRAWAVFPNHYHFVAFREHDASELTLSDFIKELHSRTAIAINKVDETLGRTVWFNYRDKALTYEGSYYARLNYVHQNAVKHGLVTAANQYPYCSARWFENNATAAQVNTIYSFPTDKLRIYDEYS